MDFPGEKLVIKMWETLVEKGIGSLLLPWHIKREGRSRNELLLMLAQTEREAAEVRAGRKSLQPDGTLVAILRPEQTGSIANERFDRRVEPTLSFPLAEAVATTIATETARREINSAKAILFAEELLASDLQQPTERTVDEDWLFAWREYAGRVSNEDLQRLWGSVLAGEIKSPGRHSVRTLEFLRSLSKPEAELIALLASFVLDGQVIRSQAQYLSDQGLSFEELLRLQELGILSGVDAISLLIDYKTNEAGRFIKGLVSHNKALIVEHADETKTLTIEVYSLTMVGREILTLGSFTPDTDYLRAVGKGIASNGQGFTVRIADWQQETETMGRFFNPFTIDA
jgi:hypothetical protein